MRQVQDLSLAKLLIRAQNGDRDAYKDFLSEITIILRNFLMKKLENPEAAEDVLQEALIAIHKGRYSYLQGRPIKPWIFAICEHRLIDYIRKNQRQERLEKAIIQETHVAYTGSPFVDLVMDALSQLPFKQRSIIEKMKLQGLTVKEVAAEIGMSESGVKTTAFRGYEAIRKILRVRSL